jgi:hypothetical protein
MLNCEVVTLNQGWFAGSSTRSRVNNLTNHPIVFRDNAKADLKANVETARRDWFVDPQKGDLRLAHNAPRSIDAGASDRE